MEDNTELTMEIKNCPMCSGDHPALKLTISSGTVISGFASGKNDTTLIAACPNTGKKFEVYGTFEEAETNG